MSLIGYIPEYESVSCGGCNADSTFVLALVSSGTKPCISMDEK